MLQPRKFKELRKPDGYPRKLETIGDHIRAVRLERGLKQDEVAKLLGTCPTTVLDWEKNHHQPTITAMKEIIRFLGFNPLDSENTERTFGEQLFYARRARGLSQRAAAACIGVDPSTLSHYERDKKIPPPNLLSRIEQFINS